MRRSQPAAPIALLTDFGYRDHYVGSMKGVLASIAPDAPLIDITHGVPPQSIAAGAIALRESLRFFPTRTVFLVPAGMLGGTLISPGETAPGGSAIWVVEVVGPP